jgi:HEAT repeat protein
VREKVIAELHTRGRQALTPDASLVDFNPPREFDPELKSDDLYRLGSDVWLLVDQALKSWETIDLYPLLDDEAEVVRWQTISALRTRGEIDTFNRASAMCADEREGTREQGAMILCQLGPYDVPEPLRNRAVPLLLKLLSEDPSPEVRSAAAFAFGHIEASDEARDALVRASKDADEDVRYGVAFGLGKDENPAATKALLDLMEDSDEDVRDWATFGIGTMQELDSPEIREALLSESLIRRKRFAWKPIPDSPNERTNAY